MIGVVVPRKLVLFGLYCGFFVTNLTNSGLKHGNTFAPGRFTQGNKTQSFETADSPFARGRKRYSSVFGNGTHARTKL